MLEGLDRIDWSQLSHAYGPATDVPGLLRALASEPAEEREESEESDEEPGEHEEALEALGCSIWHQGTVYGATAPTVPFLIELVEEPSVPARAELLYLLQLIARGSSYLDVHQDLDFYRHAQRTEEHQSQLRRELEWVDAARAAVLAGTPVYLQLLADPDPAIRSATAHLLASCSERAAEIEPALRERVAVETDPKVKSSLITSLARFWTPARGLEAGLLPAEDRWAFLSALARAEAESPLVRFTAALTLLRIGPDTHQDEALAILRQTVHLCGTEFAEVPGWDDQSPLGAVSEALRSQPEVRQDWLQEMLLHPVAAARNDAIEETWSFCREWRPGPAAMIPHLVRRVGDPDPEVRQSAADVLPYLGAARMNAVETLEALERHGEPDVRKSAAAALRKLRESRPEFTVDRWLERWRRKPLLGGSVRQLAAVLERTGRLNGADNEYACAEAAACLELHGPSARAAVPALRSALDHELHWVRIFAARALWKIESKADEVLPVLLAEIQCSPPGLVAVDGLGEMGRAAQAAIPKLHQLVDMETRPAEMGTIQDWIDEDEGFQVAARQALERIRN